MDDDFGNFDMGYGVAGTTAPWETPPYFPEVFTPPSIEPSVLQSILGTVLNAVVPSAQAMGSAAQIVRASTPAAVAATAGAAVVGAGLRMAARGMSDMAAAAIYTLRQRLTGAAGLASPGALAAYGRRAYASLAAWVRNNPGTSAITLLTGLGLSAEMAAHFLAWGATSKKRTKSRGISGRDIKTARRTIRKITGMNRLITAACAPTRPHFRRAKRC